MSRRVLFVALCLVMPQLCWAASTVIYSTGFEQAEGYDTFLPLAVQRGWVGSGTGGNGVKAESTNQYAYIGYAGPTSDSETSASVWKPINYGAVPTNSVLKFSVDVVIQDSSGIIDRDEFRWSVYNNSDDKLFSLILDNDSLGIFFLSSAGQVFDTGFSFDNGISYNLVIIMDFVRNRWNASMNGTDLMINSPISVGGAALTFGDVDAVWVYADPMFPGNNFMRFDNYRISLESATRPSLQTISTSNRQLRLRVFGENGARYAVDASSSLPASNWIPLRTNVVSSGSFDFLDPLQPPPSGRFYRARWAP